MQFSKSRMKVNGSNSTSFIEIETILLKWLTVSIDFIEPINGNMCSAFFKCIVLRFAFISFYFLPRLRQGCRRRVMNDISVRTLLMPFHVVSFQSISPFASFRWSWIEKKHKETNDRWHVQVPQQIYKGRRRAVENFHFIKFFCWKKTGWIWCGRIRNNIHKRESTKEADKRVEIKFN